MRRIADSAIARPWAVLAGLALIAFAVWAYGTRTQAHHVVVAFDSATSIATGMDVQVGGVDVGKVAGVERRDGQAIVRLGIDDDSVWPLHDGTTAAVRFGTTVGNGTRRIDLVPGPASARPLPENGVIPARHAISPTEFDQLFDTFDAATRDDVRGLARNGAATLRDRSATLDAALQRTAPGMEAVSGVLADLGSDERALRTFIDRTGGAMAQLASRRAQIRALMTVGAQTFRTFAANTSGVQRSLEQAAPTLVAARGTLARLDRSVGRLDALLADLGPGARALRPLAAAARPALAALRRTVPEARGTVRTATHSAPEITALLRDGAPFMTKTAPVLSDLAPMLACIRPYAPEIAGFFTNWASFSQAFDGTSHYARVRGVEGPTSLNDVPDLTTAQFLAAAGAGTVYAGLRPPGYNGGKPQFMPECGVGRDVLDPAKDWEDGR